MIRTISAGALALVLGTGAAIAQQGGIPDAPRPSVLPTVRSVGPSHAGPEGAPAQDKTEAPAAQTAQAPAAAEQTGQPPVPVEAPAGQGQSEEIKLFQLPTVRLTLVVVPFSVKDSKGNLVSGLTNKDIRIYENGTPQNLVEFTADPYPLSVAIIVDQSMAFTDMDKVNTALGAIQGAFAPYDEVAYFTVNNGPKKWTDFTGAQSDRLKAVVEVSRAPGRDGFMPFVDGPLAQNVYKNGGTELNWDPNTNSSNGARANNNQNIPKEVHTLNDAIMAAAKELTRVGRGRRRVIYIISNGNEYGSKAKKGDVKNFLQSHEITVYATLVHDFPNLHIPFSGFLLSKHLPFQMQSNILPYYANATGGLVDPELTSHGIITSLNKIAETARTRYTAIYRTSEPPMDGKYRTIDVRVLGHGSALDVIAKPGYYPTADRAPATADPTPPPPPGADQR